MRKIILILISSILIFSKILIIDYTKDKQGYIALKQYEDKDLDIVIGGYKEVHHLIKDINYSIIIPIREIIIQKTK